MQVDCVLYCLGFLNCKIGATEEDFEKARNADLKPTKVMTDGITYFLLETESPLYLSDWAVKAALPNPSAKPKRSTKI
jgi:homogentisate 1,2-dioxygenase